MARPREISPLSQVCEEFRCEYCGARPGERCHSVNHPSSKTMVPHQARFTAATEAGKLPLR